MMTVLSGETALSQVGNDSSVRENCSYLGR
jgi:hypothetical protein